MPAVGTLPAGGRQVRLGEPSGEDELLVVEGSGSQIETAIALATRLVTDSRGEPLDWSDVPAVDLSAALLLIRSVWIGSTIHTEALCPASGCGEPIDITFGIQAYLDHHRPRPFRGVSEAEPGWFALAGAEVRFRIPTVADLLPALEAPGPTAAALLERCVRPFRPPAAVARRIERALDALAPPLDGELGGVCPLCGEAVELWFEPIGYLLQELRDASASLTRQVHELAFAYHWSERAIMALARRRRHAYVDLVHGELALA